MFVTRAQLQQAALSGDAKIIAAIADNSAAVFAKYGLNTRNRVLAFLSTAYEETGGFRVLTENLNYTAERLVAVWPSRFPNVTVAAPFAHNPRVLANRVYGGRMGNTGTDDGWRYRGQGLLQATGRDNFALFEKLTGLSLLAQPEFATDPAHMLECAVALFVQFPGILAHCDGGDWISVWALVGSGRASGPVINLVAHQDALTRLSKAIPATPGGQVTPAPPAIPAKPAEANWFWRLLSGLYGVIMHKGDG